MSGFKDKDSQRIYEAILESKEIQKLIRKIVREDSDGYSKENFSFSEINELRYQLSQTKLALQKTSDELEKYKDFYVKSKDKVEKYDIISGTCEQYEKSISFYESEITRKNAEIEILKNSNNTLENKNDSLTSKLKLACENITQMKKQFEYPIKYFEVYKSLSILVKRGLENVINSENEITFIVSCSNEDNLYTIWEYIKEISNDSAKSREFEVLTDIFNYFFDVFNASLPEEKYIRDDIEIGEEFDGDYMDRCYGSATSGNISQIVLRGYKLKNSGKIVHKSFVKV